MVSGVIFRRTQLEFVERGRDNVVHTVHEFLNTSVHLNYQSPNVTSLDKMGYCRIEIIANFLSLIACIYIFMSNGHGAFVSLPIRV